MRTSDIHINVELDENRVPENIRWSASDGGVDNANTEAIMVSVWDEPRQELLKIDLWTKDMRMDDMKKFIHQNLLSLAHTAERATSDEKMASHLREFARYYAEESGLLDKK